MDTRGDHRTATITVELEETTDQTQAKVELRLGERQLGGWGRARRNPSDPDVPKIGEELAIARALSDLSHQLVEAAATDIEKLEGHPVDVHI